MSVAAPTRKRRLRHLTALVLLTALTLLAGRLDSMALPSSELPVVPKKHVNPARPLAARAQMAHASNFGDPRFQRG